MYKDYETPIKAVHDLGGCSMINHPGDTTGSYADPSVNNDPKTVNKYASPFLKYWPSCFALDINSISDGSRTDEVLYDNVLEKLIPYGIMPWLVCFSDAHQMGQWNRGFTLHMMKESLDASNKDKAVADLKRSMRDGTYFGVYTFSPGGVYLAEDAVPPMVKDIVVNGNTITIVPEDEALVTDVVWVTNGTKEINKGNYTIDAADFAGDIKSYVRAYLRGPGGICYTQPFTVIPEGTVLEKEKIDDVFDISVFLRGFVTILDTLLFKHSFTVSLFKRYALGGRQLPGEFHLRPADGGAVPLRHADALRDAPAGHADDLRGLRPGLHQHDPRAGKLAPGLRPPDRPNGYSPPRIRSTPARATPVGRRDIP